MINVTNEFKELMKTRTDFKENAQITFADGSTLNLSEDDFSMSNNGVVDSAGARNQCRLYRYRHSCSQR